MFINIINLFINYLFYKFYNILNLISFDKNFYIIWYFYNFKWYAIKISKQRGPLKLWKVFHKNIDVTPHLLPFMGPYYNFHSLYMTPKNFGYSELEFKYNDISKKFLENDTILL